MSEAEQLPDNWLSLFDGTDVETKLATSALLCTVDADGWPHASFLGVGEILAHDRAELSLMLWPTSTTAANLVRRGTATLFTAVDGDVWETRLEARAESETAGQPRIFRARIAAVRRHHAPYAEVDGMVSFRLHDPATVVDRWKGQIARLRETS